MTQLPLPPLPPDVQALLEAAERGAPPPPPGLEAALFAKVTATVALPVAGTAATLPFAAVLGKPLVALALAVGIGGTVVVVVATREKAPVIAHAAQPSASASAPIAPIAPIAPVVPLEAPVVPLEAPVASAPVDVPVEAAPVAPAAKRRPVVEREQSDDGEARASESALLDDAREALARGDGDRALAKLQEQARLFPHGRLQEERRALTVVAFAQRGDRARARSAARAFEREHPSSLFLEMVRAAVVDEGGAK